MVKYLPTTGLIVIEFMRVLNILPAPKDGSVYFYSVASFFNFGHDEKFCTPNIHSERLNFSWSCFKFRQFITRTFHQWETQCKNCNCLYLKNPSPTTYCKHKSRKRHK